MKTTALTLLLALALLACGPVQAWSPATHQRIVLDAIQFMRNNPATTNYSKLVSGVAKAGYSIELFAVVAAQGAHDVDYFQDTFICGATTGNCVSSPLWGAGSGLARYSSFWHFQDHTAGKDVHGNAFGGYNYSKLSHQGDIDVLAATWLVNDYLDDGPGGMSGWFGDDTRYNTFGVTEARYRLGGYSTPSMYQDFQNMPFQPIGNLGQYYWSQFLKTPTAQSLGFALHTTDLLEPHHTWNTLGNNHDGYEKWVAAYYDSEKLNDPLLVQAAMADIMPVSVTQTDIRPLLSQAGTYSYNYGGAVLSSTDHAVRRNVAKKMIPHSIALVVRILNRAAERLVF